MRKQTSNLSTNPAGIKAAGKDSNAFLTPKLTTRQASV